MKMEHRSISHTIMIYSLSVIVLALMSINSALAYKERKDIRSGNDSYQKGNYSKAEVDYKRAITKDPQSFPAYFNMAGSIYKQPGRMEEAEKLFMSIKDSDASNGYAKEDEKIKAKVMYNLGNAQLSQRKIDEAIESYKSSLRIDPDDKDAKFNLAYAQKLKQDQQQNQDNQDQQNQDNQDQQDQQQDKDKKDQNGDKDQNQDNSQQDQNDKSEQQDKPENNQDQNPANKQDNERMLKAVQAAEDKTQRQLNQRKQKDEEKEKAQQIGVVGGVRNW